jgi:hypothetical protein
LRRENFTEVLYRQNHQHKQSEYENIRDKIVTAFNKIELLSVVEGTRNAHLNFFLPSELEPKLNELKKYGLTIVTLNKEANNKKGSYGNHSMPYQGGDDFVWRSIITKPENVQMWKDIWDTRSRDVLLGEFLIGRGLGYPECCSRFFTRVWMQDAGIDTTWQQALCTKHECEHDSNAPLYNWNLPQVPDTTIELGEDTPIWASNLLRWAGMKIVTHLPCSFNCTESKRIALENLGLATKHGFGYEYNKLCEMLAWDTTWTAHMGIATIETPIFVINTVTDITADKYVVHKKGHNNCIL